MEIEAPKNKKLNKDILNIIRTTMRNNIELTHIADNKANVLLSLSALMITFLLPIMIPYVDTIVHYKLGFPLGLLVLTCFVTIYISALVLKPGNFKYNKDRLEKGKRVSPFFFGNFYKMDRKEYRTYLQESLADNDAVRIHITEDLHYVGARLGVKMSLIRIAFNIFMIGLFTSVTIAVAFMFLFGK